MDSVPHNWCSSSKFSSLIDFQTIIDLVTRIIIIPVIDTLWIKPIIYYYHTNHWYTVNKTNHVLGTMQRTGSAPQLIRISQIPSSFFWEKILLERVRADIVCQVYKTGKKLLLIFFGAKAHPWLIHVMSHVIEPKKLRN